MKGLKLRIKNVDMNGYCGREHHPSPSDAGLIVIPLQMETSWMDPKNGDEERMLETRDVPYVLLDSVKANDPDNHVVVWYTVTADGRLLDLMGHEVEVVLG